MSELIKTKDQIVMKRNTTFLGIGVFAILMAASGIRLLFEILPFEPDYTFADVLVNTFFLYAVGIIRHSPFPL